MGISPNSPQHIVYTRRIAFICCAFRNKGKPKTINKSERLGRIAKVLPPVFCSKKLPILQFPLEEFHKSAIFRHQRLEIRIEAISLRR
jgi:hypothetical protein